MVFSRILHETTGCIFELLKENRVLERHINELKQKSPVEAYQKDERSQLSDQVVMPYLDESRSQRIRIEDKARTNVLGLTLAFTAMFAGIALVSSSSTVRDINANWSLWLLLALLCVGVSFLFMGGWLALMALRVAGNYVWTPWHETIPKEVKVMWILWCLELNQKTTLVKANQVDCSYSCLRNGIFALAGAAIVVSVLLSYQIGTLQDSIAPVQDVGAVVQDGRD